jgi:hypothetical protein
MCRFRTNGLAFLFFTRSCFATCFNMWLTNLN